MTEADFLTLLRPLATHPAARGLLDDAAVLGDLVLTHDVLVEGVHFLPGDSPETVAWKLVAVNLSDLAAKGATPVGVLLGYPLSTSVWDAAFVRGLGEALTHFDVPLLGGDTVTGPRVLSLTAIGRAEIAPSRSGARASDRLWVTGTIGRAGLGLAGDPEHLEAFRRPVPRLAEGRALASLATAMMDVSDGLLIDARRMADASGLRVTIDLDAVPLVGERIAAVTAGDDYELLFSMPDGVEPPVQASQVGTFAVGGGIALVDRHGPVPLPQRLGWQHGI